MNRSQRRAAMAQLGRPPWMVELSPGGYRVLHPTKGWRQVSIKRPGAALVVEGLSK